MQTTQAGLQVMPMSESHQNAIMAKIGIFEIRSFIGQHKSRNHTGYFNVKAKLDISSDRPRPIITWLTGNEAVATMESGKQGMGIMYMPDDPWGNNRLRLLNLPKNYEIIALHTSDGVVPGAVVKEQLRLLRSRITETTTVWRILENGIAISDRATEEEANREIETLNEMIVKVDRRTGQEKVVPLKNVKYEVIKVEGSDFTQEIKNLVKKYRNIPYGWTACAEFQAILKEVRSAVEETAEAVSAPADPKHILNEMFASMSKSEKAAILASILKGEEEKPETPTKKTAKKEVEV